MAWVPGGPFTMGADEGGEPDERPAHQVEVDGFWLDLTEVTQRAYEACVEQGVCRAPKEQFLTKWGGAFRGPDKPVIGVSQVDAGVYCKHIGKRLPREAEFEKAARGTDARVYPWGNEAPTHEHAVWDVGFTEAVGTHPRGDGPYGHHDLAGNVWEWLADAYDPAAYTRPGAARGEPGSCEEILAFQDGLRRSGRQGFTGSNPIPTKCEVNIRGGAYNMWADALRTTNRVHHPAGYRLQMTGFRCARTASEDATR